VTHVSLLIFLTAMIMLKGEEHQLLKKQSPEEMNTLDVTDTSQDEEQHQQEEEMESSTFYLDEEDEARIMEMLMSPAAIPGGQSRTDGKSYHGVEPMEGDDEGFLQSWLDEEDDFDDGATIIIGRIQYFMGEMRQYTGMPASSTIDSKDRPLGDVGVSGSARRRGAVHRQGDRWQEGDYGRKERDYEP